MSTPADLDTTRPQARRGRGWLFWGCLTILLLGLALVGVLGFGVYQVYRFTSTEPVPVPTYEPGPGEANQVRERIEAFASEKPPSKEPEEHSLTLTGDDLNALIAGSEEGKRYAGKVFVRVEGDRAFADVSLPLEDLRDLGVGELGDVLAGRYLNATVEVEAATTEDGKPILRVASMVAGGKSVPRSYVGLLPENLLEALSLDRVEPSMKTIQGLSIRDGKIVVER